MGGITQSKNADGIYYATVTIGCVVASSKALDLQSIGRGFDSQRTKLRNNLGQVVHTQVHLSVSPSSIKVTAGLAESNGSLPPGAV